MFESHVVSLVTSVDRTSFYFQFDHIFGKLVNIHLLISFHFFKVELLFFVSGLDIQLELC